MKYGRPNECGRPTLPHEESSKLVAWAPETSARLNFQDWLKFWTRRGALDCPASTPPDPPPVPGAPPLLPPAALRPAPPPVAVTLPPLPPALVPPEAVPPVLVPPVPVPPAPFPPVAVPPPEPPVLGWPPVDVVPPLPLVVAGFVPEEVHCQKRALNASSPSRERCGYMAFPPGWA